MADDDPDEELEVVDPDPVEPEDLADPDEPAEPEAGGEAAAAPAGETQTPEPQPERQPSRGEQRIRALSEQLKERDLRLAETNRRLDELIRAQGPARPQGESPEQRAARFAVMTPQEQIAETLRESEARHAQQMTALQMQMLDAADRTTFQAKAASDPLYAKWAPRVEGKLAELRAKGNNVERDILLKFMIGEAALERRASKEGKQETRQAQRRVASQRARPVNSGSDQQAQRRQVDNLERRLENVNL
jgi:hypothetical protein